MEAAKPPHTTPTPIPSPHSAHGALNINRVVDKLTNGSAVIALNQTELSGLLGNSSSVTVPLNTTGTVHVALEGVRVSGLDSWSAFDVLRPTNNYTLRSHTAMDALRFEVDFFITAEANQTGPVRDGALHER